MSRHGSVQGRHFSYEPDHEGHDPLYYLWILSLCAMVAMWVHLLWTGQTWETWLACVSTLPLYVMFILCAGFGIVWWYKHDNFITSELVVYLVVMVPMVYVCTALGFLHLTDLGDVEIWNGVGQKFEWTEGYYTRHHRKGGSYTINHAPVYKLYTNNAGESVTMSSSDWNTYVSHWGGKGRVTSSAFIVYGGESLIGSNHNGIPEKHTITWDGSRQTRVITHVEHVYANFLKASDSVQKIHGAMSGHEKFLASYPRVTSGAMGPIDFDRLICKDVVPPSDFAGSLRAALDSHLCEWGGEDNCNIVVYLVGADNEGCFNAIQENWSMGKRNEVTVVIGCPNNHIAWCRVMAWTNNKLFAEKLEAEVRDLNALQGKGGALADLIVRRMKASDDSGYVRKPMKEYEYLAAEVSMPYWVGLLVGIGSCIMMLPTIFLVVRD